MYICDKSDVKTVQKKFSTNQSHYRSINQGLILGGFLYDTQSGVQDVALK